MTTIRKSIDVEAPASAVWAVFADFAAVAEWHPYFEGSRLEHPEPVSGVGAARICDFGPRMAIRETVRQWVDDQRMVIGIDFVKGPPSPIDDIEASVDTIATGNDTSELALTMSYQRRWGPIGAVLDALVVKRQYETVLGNMLVAARDYAESGRPPEQIAMIGSGRKL